MSSVPTLPRAHDGGGATRLLEGLLWAAGALLLGWCLYVLVAAHLYQTRQETALDAVRSERAVSPGVSESLHTSTKASIRGLDPLLIGKIEIPRLAVSSIIREGVDEDTLSRAVGHVPGTALFTGDGNVGLAGHRDTFFRGLKEIAKGDAIRVKTPSASYEYHVVSTSIVWPDDTRVLESDGTPMLTLVTCWPFSYVGHAPKRFVVKARRVPI